MDARLYGPRPTQTFAPGDAQKLCSVGPSQSRPRVSHHAFPSDVDNGSEFQMMTLLGTH